MKEIIDLISRPETMSVTNVILSGCIVVHLVCEFAHYIHEFWSHRKDGKQVKENGEILKEVKKLLEESNKALKEVRQVQEDRKSCICPDKKKEEVLSR